MLLYPDLTVAKNRHIYILIARMMSALVPADIADSKCRQVPFGSAAPLFSLVVVADHDDGYPPDTYRASISHLYPFSTYNAGSHFILSKNISCRHLLFSIHHEHSCESEAYRVNPQCLYMLISLPGHPFWSVYDSSRAVEATSKIPAESTTRAGERKGEVGGSGKEDNGRHQTKCESWEYGACSRPTDVKIRADKVIHYYRMLAKYLLKTLCEHEDISKSSRR